MMKCLQIADDILLWTCCYFVTEFSKPVPTHYRVDLWRNLCTSLLYLYCVHDVVVAKTNRIAAPS